MDTGIPQIKMDFTKISDLENCENNSFVDIIGIATDVGDVQNLTARFEHYYLCYKMLVFVLPCWDSCLVFVLPAEILACHLSISCNTIAWWNPFATASQKYLSLAYSLTQLPPPFRSSGKQLTKREVKLQDKSGAAVALTLWGKDAEQFDTALTNPVISVKAAKVSDFGGRSLSVSFNSTLQV